MKEIDFSYQNKFEKEEPINEVLGSILICGALCYFISIGLSNGIIHSLKKLNDIKKEINDLFNKDSDKKRNIKRKENELENESRKSKRALKKATKQMIALEKAIDKMPDGKDKEKYEEQLKGFSRIMNGTGTKDDYNMIEKESKRELTKDEKDAETSANYMTSRISDDDTDRYMERHKYSLDNISKSAQERGILKLDDKSEETPKETIKDMEVEDPDTGKKVMRKVHIGPLGGKYYWPDKAPHDADHKVYVSK